MYSIIIAFLVLMAEFFVIEHLSITRNRKNTITYIVVFIELFILSGWRDITVLADTIPYLMHFEVLDSDTPFYQIDIEDRFEKGYLLFEKFIHNIITETPLYFNIITSFLILTITFLFFAKYSKCAWLTLFLYISLRFCVLELTTLRQTFALLVSFGAYEAIKRDKNILFFLLVLLAITFHNSAYYICIYWFIFHIKPNNKIYLISIWCLLFAYTSYSYFFVNYINIEDSIYFENSAENNMISPMGIFYAIEALLFYTIILFLNKKNNSYSLIDKRLTYLSFFYFMTNVMSIRLFIFTRMALYIQPLIIVYIANQIYILKQRGLRHFITSIMIVYSIATFFYLLATRPEWFKIYPYKFYGT